MTAVKVMTCNESIFSLFHHSPDWWERYELNCTFLAAHGGVTPPLNGMAIQGCRALPCTTLNAHFNSSNCRF
uniref:Uncharacterized protein n=1 Tax=mine drainage metagenome TaxID=410659 RepID=E6QRW1_9ZZZZ